MQLLSPCRGHWKVSSAVKSPDRWRWEMQRTTPAWVSISSRWSVISHIWMYSLYIKSFHGGLSLLSLLSLSKRFVKRNLICRAFCRCSWFLRHFTFCRGASGFMNCIPFSNWAYSSLQEQLHSQKDTTANTTTMNNHNRVFGQICLRTFREKEYIDQNWPI